MQTRFLAPSWTWRILAVLLILAAAGLHVLYLAGPGALDLSPDEAHYWVWSRHLDWSYYSKGPLVAYLIRLGTTIAGGWSQQLTHSEMMAVRLPAVVCGSLLLASLYVLTLQVYRSDRLAFIVMALALTFPVIAAGASIMTIDAPYTCCWGWALVAGHRACFRRSWWAWPLAGLLVGLGILAKYTMVAWLPSLGLFLLFDPERRSLLWRPGFWVMTLVAAICCLPILIWNAQHDWVTVRHVFVQAGVQGSRGMCWFGPLRFLAMQFGLMLGYWFVCWLSAMYAHRPWKESDPGIRYLWWLSAPMFLMFFFFGFRTNGGEPNWPVTAYLSGMVLMVAWLMAQFSDPRAWWRRGTWAGMSVSVVIGLLLIVVMHHSAWIQPLLTRLSGEPTESNRFPLRRFDPTCRLRGWKYLAQEVDRIRREVREQDNQEPIIAGSSWTLPGELEFYCEGHPAAYSVGLALGDRWSQFDIWHPNPVLDPDSFQGRTFVLIGNPSPLINRGFADGVKATYPVLYEENGQPIACWQVLVCKGYRELPKAKLPGS